MFNPWDLILKWKKRNKLYGDIDVCRERELVEANSSAVVLNFNFCYYCV